MDRRAFIAAGVAAAWLPVLRVPLARGQSSGCPAPPEFPAGLELYRQGWENWSKEIVVEDLWTCPARDARDVVTLANWARRVGWRIRPRGAMHGWSPLGVTPGAGCDARLLLVDTTHGLTGLALSGDGREVTAGAGVTLLDLLTFLESHGRGLTATPAIGDPTVGGMLAIGAHGTGVPAAGEARRPGQAFGSLSGRVTELEAVVWSGRRERYVRRRFTREDPALRALATHLGRAFVTEATLRVAEDQNLRCVSRFDVPASELLGRPAPGARTLQRFLDEAGRAEVIWFPFTDAPWLKVWSVEPEKPAPSREVSEPYNYPFTDSVPEELALLADELVTGHPEFTPQFAQMELEVARNGVAALDAGDLWGPSKNTLLYIRRDTLRITTNGYAVPCRRDQVQDVIADFTEAWVAHRDAHAARGSYPVNGPLEIRVTGVERGFAPHLSALTPTGEGRDVAVWFDLLSFPGTPGLEPFLREIEQWMLGHYAVVRPEWSKGWGYAPAPWDDDAFLRDHVPAALPRHGRARRALNRLDPHRVYANDLLDRLLP